MSKVILIVEDDVKSMKLAKDLLLVSGYETIEVVNGLEAVRMAVEQQPDLILMDMQLPGMDGFRAAGILKANEKTSAIPIIALTAYAMKGDDEKVREAGCEGYLTKPIRVQHFLGTIAATIGQANSLARKTA
jgi:two-component system cell cycle response regulator DivK